MLSKQYAMRRAVVGKMQARGSTGSGSRAGQRTRLGSARGQPESRRGQAVFVLPLFAELFLIGQQDFGRKLRRSSLDAKWSTTGCIRSVTAPLARSTIACWCAIRPWSSARRRVSLDETAPSVGEKIRLSRLGPEMAAEKLSPSGELHDLQRAFPICPGPV